MASQQASRSGRSTSRATTSKSGTEAQAQFQDPDEFREWFVAESPEGRDERSGERFAVQQRERAEEAGREPQQQ